MKRRRPAERSSCLFLNRRRHSRRGSWLVQVVVTMTVMSVLMTIASTSLFQMFRQESRMVERAFQTSSWLRLTQDFREDVHSALTIKQTGNSNRLDLVTAEGPGTWLADGENHSKPGIDGRRRHYSHRPPARRAVCVSRKRRSAFTHRRGSRSSRSSFGGVD